ncbi:MAG: hypothetical protein PHT12_00565 [Patescibacteria group bacterium]|nr:hypothetical protein [Patescibacteria group bacterium]
MMTEGHFPGLFAFGRWEIIAVVYLFVVVVLVVVAFSFRSWWRADGRRLLREVSTFWSQFERWHESWQACLNAYHDEFEGVPEQFGVLFSRIESLHARTDIRLWERQKMPVSRVIWPTVFRDCRKAMAEVTPRKIARTDRVDALWRVLQMVDRGLGFCHRALDRDDADR